MTNPAPVDKVTAFEVERYKYILQQLHTVNENVYRFLAIYQTLATVLVGAALALFVRYEDWGIRPGTARIGVVAILLLVTFVALFTLILIVMGMFTWWDYRKEECEFTGTAVRKDFRKPPEVGNIWRWYETWIGLFILLSISFMWLAAGLVIIPAIG
ncbi:hypothetical protein [Symbioplanes lichenis]|uniref:hypothetical protein n=1 Tax=Symbioplanes lichenis TaxID=1629072 RepID=UPI002739CCF2|nr:hypothetical protein [Actinoplanes lichenis]